MTLDWKNGPQWTIRTQALEELLHLLESGVRLEVTVGGTLAELLCEQIGIPRDYLDGRIQTLFLNAKAVDDVDTARVTDGAVIALSAAMPGLVGATMRKGGVLSGLRAAISERSEGGAQNATVGTITLKLFNLIAREMGPHLLERGVHLPGNRMADLLKGDGAEDVQLRQGGEPLSREAALDLCAQHAWIGVQLERG